MSSGGAQGPPMGFSQPSGMQGPAGGAPEVVVAKDMVPEAQTKYPTDVVSRQLVFYPATTSPITSSNASQTWSIWMPGGNMLDTTMRSLTLRGTFKCSAASSPSTTAGYQPQPMPLPRFGNLIQQVSFSINNERVSYKMNAHMHLNLVKNLHRCDDSANSWYEQDQGLAEGPNGPRAYTADSGFLKGSFLGGPLGFTPAGAPIITAPVGLGGMPTAYPFMQSQAATLTAAQTTVASSGPVVPGIITVTASGASFAQTDIGRTICIIIPASGGRWGSLLGGGGTQYGTNVGNSTLFPAGSQTNALSTTFAPKTFILGQITGYVSGTVVTIIGSGRVLGQNGGTSLNIMNNVVNGTPVVTNPPGLDSAGTPWRWQFADYLGIGYQLPKRGDRVPILAIEDFANGRDFEIDLAVPGELLHMQGLMPLNRLPRPRLDLVFNTANSVLYIPNTASFPGYSPGLGDFAISNLRVNAMFAQSPSLVSYYNKGDWTPTFTGIDFFSVPLSTGLSQSLPIPMTYKSAKYLVGFFCNPGQFTGAVGVGSDYPAGTTSQTPFLVNSYAQFNGTTPGAGDYQPGPLLTGVPNGATTAAGLLNPASDYTRTENYYGLGGCYGGTNNMEGYVDGVANLQDAVNTGYLTPMVTFPLVGNGKNIGRVNNCFFNMNSENIYMQALNDPNEFYDELAKVFPGIKKATWISRANYPGVRFVLAINLQTPEMADKFICGARSAIGQQMAFLNFNTTLAPISGAVFQGFIAYDRTVRVEAGGRTSSDW